MNNFKIDITSEGEKNLRHAIEIAMTNAPGGKALAFRIDDVDQKAGGDTVETLTYFWDHTDSSTRLVFAAGTEHIFHLVNGWLETVDGKKRAQFIDHDGSMGRGWRIFCGDWGHAGDSSYGIFSVECVWAWYGK